MVDSPARRRIFLQPTGLIIAEDPVQVRTVLGSCVAITLWSPRSGLAAIGHSLLPKAAAPAASLTREEALRYVDTTIDLMFLAFAQRGIGPGEIEVKVFGGADNLHPPDTTRGCQVGYRNVDAALESLSARGITPTAQAVGGRSGRVIDFDTGSGAVVVRRLPRRDFGGHS
jgi:chemotaxis protein CheD